MAAERAERAEQVVETLGETPRETVGDVGDTVGAFEAKTHLSRLLEEVQRGKIITITRRGVPVAVLAPPDAVRGTDGDEEDEEGLRQAWDAWVRYRDAQPHLRATVAEILDWVKEGHR